MRRRNLLLASVALGTATTFLVAWVATLVTPSLSPDSATYPSGTQVHSAASAPWPRPTPEAWPPQADFTWVVEATAVSESRFRAWRDGLGARTSGSAPTHEIWIVQAGWPFRALQSEPSASGWTGAIALPRWLRNSAPLRGGFPVGPLWPGLVANTAAFSTAWALTLTILLLGFRALRRASRVPWRHVYGARRLACRSCSHQLLRGQLVCPECGNAVRPNVSG